MSLEDPFFVVKDEVLKALLKTRGLYEQWRGEQQQQQQQQGGGSGQLRPLLQLHEERGGGDHSTAVELRNALRSIEWDLEDLDDTVQIVEKNPAKFRIDAAELAIRKSFIVQTKEEVRQMKSRTSGSVNDDTMMDQVSLSSPPAGPGASSSRYSRVPTASSDQEEDSPSRDIASSSSTSHLLLQQQRQLVRHQDEQLSVMSESVGNIRNMSRQIGGELDEQAVMLDEFGTEIENAESKLDATMRKMAKVLHMSNDRRQWMAIGILSGATLIVLILIFAL